MDQCVKFVDLVAKTKGVSTRLLCSLISVKAVRIIGFGCCDDLQSTTLFSGFDLCLPTALVYVIIAYLM